METKYISAGMHCRFNGAEDRGIAGFKDGKVIHYTEAANRSGAIANTVSSKEATEIVLLEFDKNFNDILFFGIERTIELKQIVSQKAKLRIPKHLENETVAIIASFGLRQEEAEVEYYNVETLEWFDKTEAEKVCLSWCETPMDKTIEAA